MPFFNIFTSGERSFARDFVKAGFLIVFIATIGANVLAHALGAIETPDVNIGVVAANTAGTSRTYVEVRSVLNDDAAPTRLDTTQRSVLDDDNLVTGTARSKLGRVHLDPCKAQ
ncbi:MAG: hypothetical protein K2P80_07045 [Beijerinckiaceae bacterium]|nr:hypothetical protein [Beijerinckiaceae bacterium]